MFKKTWRVLAVLSFAGLSACVHNTEIPFDRASNGDIKTIGVLTPYADKGPDIVLATDIGRSMGLIGALVDVSMQASRDTKVAAILAEQKVDPKADFVTDVKDALSARGYAATDVAVDRPNRDLLKTYPKGGNVDAYLDVALVEYGYIAAGIAKVDPYRPFVWAKCRLVRASDGKVLMEDTVRYNPVDLAGGTVTGAVTIAPDPAFAPPDFDTLTGHPEDLVKGIDTSLKATADQIGTLVQ